MAERRTQRGARFAAAKFRPTTLPDSLVMREELQHRLTEGASKKLTIVIGSAGAGKSVLLSSWESVRQPGTTSWLSCDEADANPVRFWAGFLEAPRCITPSFGADAAELLAMDGMMSADVIAAIANDAAKLPPGSAIIVDDFHAAAVAAGPGMTDLIERWPAATAQLVLASRADPPARLHRLRMAGELCELRDGDLRLSLAESEALLANLGVRISPAELAHLHERSEGWVAAMQMAALTLRGTSDPVQAARALDVRGHAVTEYFTAEVLQQQPADVARFMLDISVLEELTAGACAAVTGRADAAELLRSLESANLFIVALDDEHTSYRYQPLARQAARAELHATDPAREASLQLMAGEWFESAGDTKRASRHFLEGRAVDHALALLQDRVVGDFLHDPALPAPLDLGEVDTSALVDAPGRLLGLAADLLLNGDWERGGEYLDLLEHRQPPIAAGSTLGARLAAMQSVRHGVVGDVDGAVRFALAARHNADLADVSDEWVESLLVVLIRGYVYAEDFEAAEREIAAALAMPSLAEPVKLVLIRGAQALAWFGGGYLVKAADAARAARADARRLGFEQHLFAVDYLRVLAGVALEQRDLDAAEHLTEQSLSITEGSRPVLEFLALLDRAEIWAARGHVRDALATVQGARHVLPGTASVVLKRADELEVLLRVSLGDLRSSADLARRIPAVRRHLLLARVALASGDPDGAREHLKMLAPAELTPRSALMHQILMAATAIEQDDPAAAAILGGVLGTAGREGFVNTVVTAAPQVTSYLVEKSHAMPEPLLAHLIEAALEVRSAQPEAPRSRGALAEPLTAAELRVLRLLPTASYLQMAEILCISHNTVKSHLRSIYQKLGVSSRADAIERAMDIRLL